MADERLVEDVDEGFGLLSGFTQKLEVGGVGDARRSAGGID